jgi:hypothetical protein
MAGPDARTLANLLAQADDASLAALLAERRVPASASWTDFFDAADALLEPASLARGIAALERSEAGVLSAAVESDRPVPAGPARDGLVAHALIDADGVVYRPLAALWGALPSRAAAAPDDEASAAAEGDAHAAERAFAASTALADVLQSALESPLSRIGSGALAAADRRRLVDSGAVESATAADELLSIAEVAGLIRGVERHWLVTTPGAQWLSARTVGRWHEVARRLRDRMPSGLRTSGGGWIEVAEWEGAYPHDSAWPAQARNLRALLQRWAMIGPDGSSPTWAQGLRDGAAIDESALQALLPAEVDRVFLQNDLTAIAPGPLEPHLDMRLRSMALRESRAQASTYRFTAESLTAALTAGETAESLREFLSTISLTGLPQPLAYEIERTAQRHGNVRVGPDWSGRTTVTSTDAALLGAIAVDQALRPLGLVSDGDRLVTRSSAETTFWMLADARYPVTAVGADGSPRALHRARLADDQEASADPASDYAPLLARLRAAHATDADSAWLGRELEQAVRAHAVLTIVVRLPGGGEREVTLEATGLGGGRLRGLDRGADVERTLPVSSIASVRQA